MKCLIFVLLTVWSAKPVFSQKNTIVYLVRHAEKVTTDPTNKDPLLTTNGQQRALDLALKLKKDKIYTIYSTDYQRTKLTAKALADERKIDIQIYAPKQLNTLKTKILESGKGKKILIVGHSNTILETIEALGGKRPIAEIKDQDYDYLFTVSIDKKGVVNTKVEHYGQKSSNQEDEQMMKAN
jgi:broad specificity phosphatase PhoE